jgi:hypothetical protein
MSGRTWAAPGGLRAAAGLLGALVWLSLIWNLPVELDQLDLPGLLALAGELALLFGALALAAPLRVGRTGRAVAWAVGLATAVVALLKLAELAVRASLGRPFNPLTDLPLASSLMHLLTGMLGAALGWLALTGLALVPILVLFVTVKAVRISQRALDEPRWRRATLAGAGLALVLIVVQQLTPAAFESWRPVPLRTSEMLVDEWRQGRVMLADRAEFRRQAADDPFRDTPADKLLTGMGDADVVLVYIESYGRSALEEERYAELLLPRLATFQRRLADAGLSAASGYLTSPTMGGQSWLAHGTLESGLWIADQSLYDLLVASDRLTLAKAFARAGRRTVAVRPAITMPWPQGPMLGYQKTYAAGDLGYQGKPYNWITMPDQYTLAAFERRERERPHAPLFAEIALISSHAPWTPIPPVLERWSKIGDGRVFSRWADAGDPPEVVWRDPERVRMQYALAIDYVLGVLASYSARFVDDRTLLILVGDHQPAPLITGEGAGRDVPMHVIGGAPELLEPFLRSGFTPGMRPRRGPAVVRMDQFRDLLLGAFSQPPEDPPTAHAAW